jgi:hypothetical protein
VRVGAAIADEDAQGEDFAADAQALQGACRPRLSAGFRFF